ncbi:hypothetical protein LLG90_12550 [Aromatoleum toluclasticum]|uniref:COG4648 family protein n=1 Tax=Aromatoleum toluclasticum TaxID=92003 RepID=UPI001D187F25|nr:hypothetical protein [Aromatoleum toluclasticum]MCC4116183.1 hypothetical protein [Aromatoleum toluclasticum]
MRPAVVRVARGLAIAVAVIAWAVAAHYTSALVDESSWGALLAIAPFAVIAAGFAWQSTRRGLMLAPLAAATLALALAWPTLARNVGWLYFVQHVGTNLLLGLGFGRTLAAGHEPLCTRVARTIHGAVSPALARYTRQVTVAWTMFFAATVAISCLLFAFGTIEAWSTFANLLTMPLVGLMFLGEYLVRLKLLPDDRSSILDAVRAYRRTSPTATPVNER